ncbi:radical SAM protein [Ihubacter sp. rT4E-8]|uniref:radical SAM protein n=1 Tax=unclassified Ihubacter TaxID=2633299 RepID=UPI003C7DEA3A
MERYGIITEKNPREIVLLRGCGCRWRRCRFCDYHLDFSRDTEANYALNQSVLDQVTGVYHRLEVINSGSFSDLDEKTMARIRQIVTAKNIRQIHFECHWQDRSAIEEIRTAFAALGVAVKVKIGIETFNALFRESYLDKGIDEINPAKIAASYDECCLLFGIPGQTAESMTHDVNLGLKYFDRVCINVMTENTAPIKPDASVIDIFTKDVCPTFIDNPRVDILMTNTDFGVGGDSYEK